MSSARKTLTVSATVFMSVLMLLSVFAMPAMAAGELLDPQGNTPATPADVPVGESDVSQDITTEDSDLVINNSSADGDISIRIDISSLADNADVSSADIDVNENEIGNISGNANFAQVNGDTAFVSITSNGSGNVTFNSSALTLTGIDTTGATTAQNLEYVIRVDSGLTDPTSSNFNADSLQTTDQFNLAQVVVENLDTGEEISTTSVTDAISEANDPTSGDLNGGEAGDQIEIRPDAGTYVFGGADITNDNTRITPLDGADVTFENNGTAETLNVSASNVEIDGVSFDQASNSQDAIRINGSVDNTQITASTFTNINDTSGQAVLNVSDGAGSVTVDNSEFVGDGVAATAIDAGAIDDSGDNLDLTVTNTDITGFDDADGTNGSAIALDNGISAATIESNNFENNDQHVDDEAGVTNLNTVFAGASNDFAGQYVTIEDSSGNIQESIYGDLDTANATNTELDGAADRTVTVAGEHTVTSTINLANNSNDGTTVTAAGSGGTIVSDADPVFNLSTNDVSNVEVSGLTFDLSGGTHSAVRVGSSNTYDGLSVVNNEFNGATGDAVVVDLANVSSTAGLSINENTFDSENDYAAIELNGTGLSGTDAFEVNGNEINDADGSDAINISSAINSANVDLSIQDNVVTNQSSNNTVNLTVSDADTVTISGNTLSGETDGAATGLNISVTAGSNVVSVGDNEISNFDDESGGGTGVSVSTGDVSLTGNTLANNAIQFDDVGNNYDEQTVINDNAVSPVVLALDERDGNIQDNAVYGTVEGGVVGAEALNTDVFLDVGPGTYNENSIVIDSLDEDSITIDGSGESTLTTETQNQIIDLNQPNGSVTISNMTFAAGADNANPDVDITNTSDFSITLENNVFSGPGTDARKGVLVSEVSDNISIKVSDNEFSGYAEAVQHDDTSGSNSNVTLNVVRNTFSSNAIAVDLTSAASNANVFRIHFNDITDNEDGVVNDLTASDVDTVSLRANWWGDESGPSGDNFGGDGDTVTDDAKIVTVDPWLTDSFSSLPADQYVVVSDPVAPIADQSAEADVLVATLNDGLAQGEDEGSTVLLGEPAGPLQITEGSGGASAADPINYTINSSQAGDYTLTAANSNDNIPDGSATQTFTGEASGVNVEVDSSSLPADDETTINATATLVDSNGNAVDRGGSYTVTWLISGSNEAGITRVTEENFDTSTPNSEARLEIRAENAGTDLTITAVADTGGYSGSASATTVEPAASNFTLSLVEGPTTITQNESYSATLEVTNEGDDAGTQTIEYDLDNSAGVSQIDASEEVSLDAGSSTEITFEVPASATADLETGNYTHVFASDDDELTVDAEVVENVTVPTDPEERALQLTGVNNASELTQDDVTAAITRFERNESANGVDPTQDDVTTVITLFERN